MKDKHDYKLIAERYDRVIGGRTNNSERPEIYVTYFEHNGGHDGFAEPKLCTFLDVVNCHNDTCTDGDMDQFDRDIKSNFEHMQYIVDNVPDIADAVVCKTPEQFKSAIDSGKLAVIQTGCEDIETGAIFVGGSNAFAAMTALYDAYVEGQW
jgi:hypothetical protein